jgi:CBS domain-containing protein
MNVSEVMSGDVYVSSPEDTLQAAAQAMADLDTGVLPVGDGDHLIGMITDRDIVIRGVARGLDPENATIRDVMSAGVCYCFDDEDVEEAARQMAELQVRRLPVLNRSKRLVGIVSLGDLSQEVDTRVTGDALKGVSEEGLEQRPHTVSASRHERS